MKCENCKQEKSIIDIRNYVVKYETWEAYNCCSEECARKCANAEGISDNEIIDILE